MKTQLPPLGRFCVFVYIASIYHIDIKVKLNYIFDTGGVEMKVCPQKLEVHLINQNLTIAGFAKKAGISPKTIRNLLSNGKANTVTLHKVCKALDISPTEIL